MLRIGDISKFRNIDISAAEQRLECRIVRKDLSQRVIDGPDKLSLPILSAAGGYKIGHPELGRGTLRRCSGFSILHHLRRAKSEQNPAY